MRRKIFKLFGIWAFDKEEQWLNEMAARGLSLVSVRFPGSYEFEECAPGEHIVRLELLEHLPQRPESMQYIRFLEETGTQYVGNIFRWAYFRKENNGSGFDLFSDIDSRIKHLKRILMFILPITVLLWVSGAINVIFGIMNRHNLAFGGMNANLGIGISNILLAVLATATIIKLSIKKSKLTKERQLRE